MGFGLLATDRTIEIASYQKEGKSWECPEKQLGDTGTSLEGDSSKAVPGSVTAAELALKKRRGRGKLKLHGYCERTTGAEDSSLSKTPGKPFLVAGERLTSREEKGVWKKKKGLR